MASKLSATNKTQLTVALVIAVFRGVLVCCTLITLYSMLSGGWSSSKQQAFNILLFAIVGGKAYSKISIE
jgi:hypothetical protein